jgi:hypothetical protein
MRNINQMPI